MIARVIGRLQPLILYKQTYRFSSFDDFKNRGKGQKSPFFGKGKGKDEVKIQESDSQKIQKQKDNPFKPRKFLQNKQKTERKDAPSQKVKNSKPASAKTQAKSQGKAASFINTQSQRKGDSQQRDSMFLKKRSKAEEVVIEKKEEQAANQDLKVQEQSQLKHKQQKIFELKYYPFYNKLAEDSANLIQIFDNKDWSSLTKMVKGYKSQAPQVEIVKHLHSLLINRNPKIYVEWVSQTNMDVKLLPNRIAKQVLYKLVDNNQYETATVWLNECKNRELQVNYQIIDNVFSEIDKNSSLGVLQSTIPIKVELTLKILDAIHRTNSKNEAIGIQKKRSSDGYIPGAWFTDIWYIANNRKVCLPDFIRVFESLLIRHHQYLSLLECHANGLFYDVMEHYYFGSHITTAKIHSLFVHAFKMDDFSLFLEEFRKRMLWYKIKTGQVPFPNARKLDIQLAQSLKHQTYEQGVFYFLLCVYGDNMKPFTIFEKDPSLLNILKMDDRFVDVINDGLFNLSRNALKSDPKPAKSQREVGQELLKKIGKPQNSSEEVDAEYQSEGYTEQDKFILKHKLIEITADRSTQVKMFGEDGDQTVENTQHQLPNISAQVGNEQNIQQVGKNQAVPVQQQQGQNNIEKSLSQQNDFLNQEEGQFFQKHMAFAQQFQPAKERDSDDSQFSENSSGQLAESSSYSEINTEEKLFWSHLQYFHRGNLRRQAYLQNNFFRRQLYKVIINSDNPVDVVKAAIKLDKPELAWTIFKQSLMQDPIKERTMKNIDYVVRAFLREHYKNHKDPMLHEVADSLHNFNYECLQFDTNGNPIQFIESIYERTQNFDKLIWDAMPNGANKYDFWESTLILDRAQELIRMDINGKLSKMHYEREYQNVQKMQVSQLYGDQMGWREELIYGLGLKVPEAEPLNEESSIWVEFQNDEEFTQFVLAPRLDQNCAAPNVQIKGYEGLESLEDILEVEENGLQDHYKEKYMPLADLQQVKALMEGQQHQQQIGEEVVPQQIQEVAQVQQSEVAAVEAEAQNIEGEQPNQEQVHQEQQIENSTSAVQNAQGLEEQVKTSPEVVNQQVAQSVLSTTETVDAPNQQVSPYKVQFGQNIFGYSQRNKVKGYDFQAFMELAQNRYKPFFEQNYETKDKQYIKYLINLESVAQQSYIVDNHQLQRKLNQAQQLVKNPLTINKMLDFGLWNFDFVTVSHPYQYILKADAFRSAFFDYKKYMGLKGPKCVPDKSKHIIDNLDEIVFSRRVTHQLVEQLLVKRFQLFTQAEAVVKLDPKQQVQQLIQWGVLNDEPIAIYMGEKLAMLTNQRISHNLALSVSKYLSHKQQVPQSRVERCKQALKIVGRINRQHIYELNKQYEHITVRKYFNRYLQKRQKQLDSTALAYMMKLQPTHKYQDTSFKLKGKISRGNLTV